jgi:hypothetical protein
VQATATASAEDFWRARHLQAHNSFVTLQHLGSYHQGDPGWRIIVPYDLMSSGIGYRGAMWQVIVYFYVSFTQTNHSHRGKQ